MRIKYLLYILSFTLILFSQRGIAQGISMGQYQNVKVSQLTDEQITAAWQKIQDSGMSEQDAYKMLIQGGMSPTEVEALKDRITL